MSLLKLRPLLVSSSKENLQKTSLEKTELLARGSEDLILLDSDDVESNGLSERSALTSRDDVTLLDVESWGSMNRTVGMTLLESVEFLDVMQISPTHHNRSFHLACGDAHTLQDLSSDRNVSGEGALLVDVSALLGLTRSLKAQADVFEVSDNLA